ncbi:MAG: C4-type zinc ribbon domain-containing protein [Bacteroidales bacterium]|jgi:predicted  nucleic acid-binding Zn-ribbon protein|nr:C4-type zinc ribbon domain-containing protein [Bacteroidales bacterium]
MATKTTKSAEKAATTKKSAATKKVASATDKKTVATTKAAPTKKVAAATTEKVAAAAKAAPAKKTDEAAVAAATAPVKKATSTTAKKATSTAKAEEKTDITTRMKALYALQVADSQIDEVRTLRGELPLEVTDLENDIARLENRLQRAKKDVKDVKEDVANRKEEIVMKTAQIAKYKKHLDSVKNNREYEALNKEIEFLGLEIQLHEKHIRAAGFTIEKKQNAVDEISEMYNERKKDLDAKKSELSTIINETETEERSLLTKSEKLRKNIDEKWLFTYDRIRKNARNGIAVARIERGACGGCFAIIAPQRQIEIRMHKKVNSCEYCGRFLVDDEIAGIAKPAPAPTPDTVEI